MERQAPDETRLQVSSAMPEGVAIIVDESQTVIFIGPIRAAPTDLPSRCVVNVGPQTYEKIARITRGGLLL